MKFLKKRGYTTIHLRSRATYTNRNPHADLDIDFGLMDEFSLVLLKTTLIAPFAEKLGFFNRFRRRILNIFRKIPGITQMKVPTFTFSHIMVPHPPYLFKKDGSPEKVPKYINNFHKWSHREKYIGQLQYVNLCLKKLVDEVLDQSGKKPVIIIQSDHGTASLLEEGGKGAWKKPKQDMLKERFDILNLAFIPCTDVKKLPADLSPVNTFKIIFNTYFNTKFKLLENRHYYSSMKNFTHLKDVSEKISTD
jgi:hypothetical protein